MRSTEANNKDQWEFVPIRRLENSEYPTEMKIKMTKILLATQH